MSSSRFGKTAPAVLTRCIAAALAATLALSVAAADDVEPVHATRQMVVAANPYAAEAGLRILRAGGSAVDAAIAVQLVLTLVEPQSSGVGGGAFMLYFDTSGGAATGKITAYEGRETAPAAATPDMFLDAKGRPEGYGGVGIGGLAVGVPGVMRMFELAHGEHGRLPWSALFAPAIALAEEGFPVSPRLHALLDGYKRFARGERFRAYFYDSSGEPRPVGYKLVNPEYAETLKLLAAQGAEPLYSGDLADRIVEQVRGNSVRAGRLTREDLKKYAAHESAPLCTDYREWKICGPQLPSSGGVTMAETLGMLRDFDVGKLKDDPVAAIHVIGEASRLAFADRNFYLGDPAFVPAPVEALLGKSYLDKRAALIDVRKALPSVSPGDVQPATAWNFAAAVPQERPSTSHFSIVDRWGDAVSMTTSVQGAFGSQLMVGGFILNDELTDFSYVPEIDGRPVANRIQGGKHPLSSMNPTIVLDSRGRLRMLIGSPGGTRIIGFVLQAVIGVLDWHMNIQQAVSAGHFLAEEGPIQLEEGTAVASRRAALEALGHSVVVRSMNSGLHGITIDYGDDGERMLSGGVDPRREGEAVGD
jgi:gamma-glutamyltranspeptidase / glutathione hydrolase